MTKLEMWLHEVKSSLDMLEESIIEMDLTPPQRKYLLMATRGTRMLVREAELSKEESL